MSAPRGKTIEYTAKVRTAGGRDGGVSHSDDGRIDLTHSVPGKPGKGPNPEQLFAAGWSACLQSAMQLAAAKMKVLMPAHAAIDAEVDLCEDEEGYVLQARFSIRAPGLSLDLAQALVDSAHRTCSYSKALRGNLPVQFTLA